jgi:hypothetical protein
MNATTSKQQVSGLFKPLIGQLVWNVRGGHGSFITLEFGEPHLSVREPVEPNHARGARVQRALRRRRVSILGDWSLFVQYCDWKISVADGSVDSQSIGTSSNECLADLDGQRLVSLESAARFNSWKFQFDLGGMLEVWPSAAYGPTDDLWHLATWNDGTAALTADGTVVEATPRQN